MSSPDSILQLQKKVILLWPSPDEICTGCLLTPLVSIQNPGSSKQEEICPRVVQTFQLWKKTESQTLGGNAVKKTESSLFVDFVFFQLRKKNRAHEKWGLLKPLVSIQNSGPENFQEVGEIGLASCSPRVLGLHTISSPCLGLSFFQNT